MMNESETGLVALTTNIEEAATIGDGSRGAVSITCLLFFGSQLTGRLFDTPIGQRNGHGANEMLQVRSSSCVHYCLCCDVSFRICAVPSKYSVV